MTEKSPKTPKPSKPPRPTHRWRNKKEIALTWVLAVVTLGYLVPWAVAVTRQKNTQDQILIFNVLGGWTVLGWLGALAVACWNEPRSYLDTGGR